MCLVSVVGYITFSGGLEEASRARHLGVARRIGETLSMMRLATLVAALVLPAPLAWAGAPAGAESGSALYRPATSATLASALAAVKRGGELEVRLTDAPPATVQFVRYDPDLEVLIYRERVLSSRELYAAISYGRIDEVRAVERRKHVGDGFLGFLIGGVVGGTIGYLVADNSKYGHGADGLVGGSAGVFLGGVTGLIVGLALPGKKNSEHVVWHREAGAGP